MKNIKTFEGFDVDYSSFDGTDLWNINEFDFIWSNKPFISDFKDINNEYGSPYQRIMLSNSLREYIELSKVGPYHITFLSSQRDHYNQLSK